MYGSSYMFWHYIAIFRERLVMCVAIHNILSTASQLSISQKALGTPPEDGKEMLKHVAATIHN
jgi:hypothetical protein